MIDDKFHLHTIIPDYLARYFNANADLVRGLVFDENFLIKKDAIAACLEAMNIISLKTAFKDASRCKALEIALKPTMLHNELLSQ